VLTKPLANISPVRLDFGLVPLNSSKTLAVTVTASTRDPLAPLRPASAAASRPDFQLTPPPDGRVCVGSDLEDGWFCDIPVTFKPSAPGAEAAILTITDNTPDGRQTVPMTANAAGLILSPSSLYFGDVGIGLSSVLPVTVTNAALTPITVTTAVVKSAQPSGPTGVLDFSSEYSVAGGGSAACTPPGASGLGRRRDDAPGPDKLSGHERVSGSV
jgi:hypothetical protein